METTTLSSSINKVVSNDDLLIEILIQLPVISLVLFKTVSKRWLGLITSPCFNLRLAQIPNLHPPSGLFLQNGIYPFKSEFARYFVSLDMRIPEIKSPFNFVSNLSNLEILQSCNGLLLISIRSNPDKFYVYNPSINMFKKLPQASGSESKCLFHFTKLDFDPIKSPNFKVLHIELINDRNLSWQTQTYSSETGIWTIGDQFPLKSIFGGLSRVVSWNGAIHWLDLENQVMHFRFDIGRPSLITSQPPVILEGTDHNLFESRGCLLYSCMNVDTHPKHLQIFEMRNECSGWVLKYLVKHQDIKATFLKTWQMSDKEFHFRVVCIVVGERDDESFLVMNMYGQAVRYNILSKTLHMLCDFRPDDCFDAFPFVASFAGV